MPYTANKKPSGLDAASTVAATDFLVIEKSGTGSVQKATTDQLTAQVFAQKGVNASGSGSERVVVNDAGTLKDITLNNIVPDLAITNAKVASSANIVDTKLATISTSGKVANSATTATSANTPNAIVARDGSGNFTAGTVTANSFVGTLTGNVNGNISGTIVGNSDTTTKWQTARNLSLTGDVTATLASVDGTAAVSAAATLANSGVSAGTYNDNAAQVRPFTVDVKGRVTAVGAAVPIAVDQTAVTGASYKKDARVATTAALSVSYVAGSQGVGATVTSTVTQVLTLDGVSPIVGDRVLVKDQASALQNGIYTVTNVGSVSTPWILTRATDADSSTEASATVVSVREGTANGGKIFASSFKASDTVGSAAQDFRELITARSDGKLDPTKINGQGYIFVQTLYHTSSTTFAKASYPWLRAIRVKCQGGGGGGGSAATTAAGEVAIGGSGGGGGYAESFITNIAGLAASETVTVGNGGAGGAATTNGASGAIGGTSSFGALVSASGGEPGGAGNNASVSTTPYIKGGSGGGLYVTGDLPIQGSTGHMGMAVVATAAFSGNGGDSVLGVGAARAFNSVGFSAYRGGGGSGAASQQSISSRAGGAGGPGIVIIELYA